MMNQITPLFNELIQVSLGVKTRFSHTLSSEEWKALYDTAKKQSLVGICFAGVQKLPEDERPHEVLYLTWMGMAAKIQQRNQIIDEHCVTLQMRLSADGFRSCILKGQGVAQVYPESLRGLRQSGDIDIWIEEQPASILKWIEGIHPLNHCDYMHTHVNLFADTEVEVHYRPWISRNLVRNFRLQKVAARFGSSTFLKCQSLDITVPCPEFNLLHQLNHIYWHLLVEGVGLRQLLDLYFSIINYEGDFDVSMIRYLKLERFTGAVMWVLGEVFGMQRDIMICEPNEKEGRFLLGEIIRAGNFGHQDDRIKHSIGENKFVTVAKWLKHVLRLLCHYPKDVLWTPIGLVYLSIKGRLLRYCRRIS